MKIKHFLLIFLFAYSSNIALGTHSAGMDLTYECLTSDTVWSSTQVVINTAAWGNECSWNIIDNSNGAIVASGNGYNSNSTYTINLCLLTGSYTFNWFDSWGDGWNGGSYNVTTNTGTVLTSGSPPAGSSGSSSFTSSNACTYTVTTYPANTYRVTLKFYRDCGSGNAGAPGSFTLNYSSSSCGSSNSSTMNQVSFQNITPVCVSISDPCNAPGVVGIEEYIYQTTITLPNNCPDWILSACICCRNWAISTINAPGGSELCVEAQLNNTNNYNNSSPVFTQYPTPYICVNQQFCYNNGAIDPDGDSLVYSLVTPMSSAFGGIVNYFGGYAASNPVTGTTTFDPLTGDLCILATAIDVTVLAMKVSEYRNGVFIGSVIRDIQVIVLNNCSTTPPVLTGLNGAPLDVTTALSADIVVDHCTNGIDPIVRTISATLGASTNKVMSWSGVNPSTVNPATFAITSNSTNNPIGTFSWIPDYLDVINSPFLFTVNVTDDACPINNSFSFTYTINLTSSSGFSVQNITTDVSCTGLFDGAINISVVGISGVPTFDWSGPNGFTANTEDISALQAGLYILELTAPDGCVTSYTYNVLSNSVAISENIVDASCNGGSDGSIDLSVGGGTIPYSFTWSNGQLTEDITNLPAGTYSVTVTDGTGCSSILSNLTIQEPTALTVSGYVSSNYNGEDISCYGGFDGQITANVSGGVGSYTYSLNNSSYSSNNVFNSLAAGLYNLSYKDGNGCITTENISLSQPPQLQSSLSSFDNISCFAAMDGSIDIIILGGTQFINSPSYNVNWLATNGFISSSTNLANITSAGTYNATITDANGCQAPSISQYILEPTALNAIATSQIVSCYGYNDGTIQLQVLGGSLPYTFSWIGPNGFNSVLKDLQGLPSGTYTYDVIDASGCSLVSPAIHDVFVAEPPEIIVTTVVTLIDCYGNNNGSIDLNISGITGIPNVFWSGPNSFYSTSMNISGLQAGVYNVVVTDPITACDFPLWEIMNPISTYNIDTNSVDISCKDSADGEITITEYNLINPVYSWTGPNGFASLQEDINNLSAGNYQVLINDDDNCPTFYSFDILEPNGLSVLSSLSKVSCEGNSDGEISLIVAGGKPPYTYIWSNASADFPLNSNLSSGSYSVAVLDAMNCPWNENYMINTEPFDTVSVTTMNVKCKGGLTGEIDIDGIYGGVSPYTYVWSNGSTNEDLIYIGAGSYSVSITDATSCTIDRWISITEPSQALSSLANIESTACYSSFDGSATLNITGGLSPYNVDWFGFDSDSLSKGSYQYNVIDSNNCPFTDNVIIPGPDSMIVIPTIVDVQCYGEKTGAISLTIQFGTGVSPYTYSWTGPNLYSSNNKDIYNLGAGEYICTVTDYNGCVVECIYNILEPQYIIAAHALSTSDYTGYQVSCKGYSDGWITINISGGIPPFTFLWSNGETAQNIYDLSAGNYGVDITNALGCTVYFPIISLNDPDSVVSAVISTSDYSSYGISCYGYNDGGIGVKAVGGVGGYSYEWTANDILIVGETNDTIFNRSENNYQVFILDQNGCKFNESIILTQPDPLVFDTIISAPDTCELEKGFAFVNIIGGVPDYRYSWKRFNGDTISAIFYVDTLSEGVYEIVVEDENICNISQIINIGNLSSPIADFSTNPAHKKLEDQLIRPFVFIGNSETFEQQIISWDWDFDYDPNFPADYDAVDSIASCSYNDVGRYKVLLTIETEYNCLDTISKHILVDKYELYIPNAFTPGTNDTINSEYFVKGVGVVDFKMTIYSKWGGIIYSSEDIKERWSGTINGKSDAISGIYTYYIEVRNIYDEIYKYEGTIKLLR